MDSLYHHKALHVFDLNLIGKPKLPGKVFDERLAWSADAFATMTYLPEATSLDSDTSTITCTSTVLYGCCIKIR